MILYKLEYLPWNGSMVLQKIDCWEKGASGCTGGKPGARHANSVRVTNHCRVLALYRNSCANQTHPQTY